MHHEGRLAIIALLPETTPGAMDFAGTETSWEDLVDKLHELECVEPRWRAVTICHIEDLPLLQQDGGPGGG